MMTDYKVTKNQALVLKLLLLCSWPILGFFMTITDKKKDILISSIIIFILLAIILRKVKIKSINKKILLIASLVACYIDKLFLTFFINRINMFQDILISITNIESIRFVFYTFVALAIFPTILFCVYWFINRIVPRIIKEFKTISVLEQKYLLIILAIGAILTIGPALVTSIFQAPEQNGKLFIYDIIYTSDNGYLANYDCWANFTNAENDIRQPLFALFSLPISIPCHIVSEILFFIPKEYAYYTVMSVFQFLLLAITTILISRLLKIKEEDKKYLYCLFSLSFPYILFGLVLEQYTIGLFYLITTIYYYYQNKEKINYLYLGAVGTMITSGIIFPFITKFKGIIDWVKKVGICFLSFVTMLVLSGQFAQIFTLSDNITKMHKYMGLKLTFYDKFVQFTDFVRSIFLAPNGEITKNVLGDISYQLVSLKTISIIGIAILIAVFISFIINRKEKMAIISFCWVIFSFIILVLVGWGTSENGQILYSLYFAWAYYVLYFLLLNKIKNRKIFKTLMIASIIIMFISMSLEMANILKFGINYFPR